MKRRTFSALTIVALIAVALAIVVGGGNGNGNSAASAAPATVSNSGSPSQPGNSAVGVRTTALGKTLVDASGRTLYLFEADGPSISRLPSAGLAAWPPFTAAAKPQARNGAVAGLIGTIRGAGGKTQVTYAGHPLYYFAGDSSAGMIAGQGLNQFGALWYVLTPAGRANTSSVAGGGAGQAPAGGGY
jgi:predicted lipoprotein with Yx(FWY)xxD motif